MPEGRAHEWLAAVLVAPQRGFKVIDRLCGTIPLQGQRAKVHARRTVRGIALDGLLEVPHGLVQLPGLEQGYTEIGIGMRRVRIQFQGSAKRGGGRIGVASRCLHDSPVIVKLLEIRIQRQCRSIVLLGPVDFACSSKRAD